MKWYVKVLQQYAEFEGRARRKEYWMFSQLFNCHGFTDPDVYGRWNES